MERYNEILKESKLMNEKNDCAIIALSLSLDKPYKEIHWLASKFGRKNGDGTRRIITFKIIEEYGKIYKKYFDYDYEYDDFKKAANIKGKYILTRHLDGSSAEEFVKIFGRRVMIGVRHHVATVVDGVLEDLSVKRSLRIRSIITLEG